MPDKKTEEELNKKNINTDAVVITSDSKNNVFDFLGFIENSTENNAIKLKKIMQYGITDEILLSTYRDIAGSIETEEMAIASLESIFTRLATYLSVQPNGIVIDFETGEIDPIASFDQAVRVGIYDEKSVIDSTDDFIIESIKRISERNTEFTEEYAQEYIDFLNVLSFNVGDDKAMREALKSKKTEDLSFSDDVKNLANKNMQEARESDYEKDSLLYEITDIELKAYQAQGTPFYDAWLKKREEFYEKHKEYLGKVNIRKKDGSINVEEANRFEKFKDAYMMKYILITVDYYKKLQTGELKEVPEKTKQSLLFGVLAGLNYSRKHNEVYKEIAQECANIIENMVPGLNLDDKYNPKTQKLFSQFIKEQFGIEEEINKESISALAQAAYFKIGENMQDLIKNDKAKDMDVEKINIDIASLLKKTSVMKFFEGSKVEFSKQDELDFNNLYKLENVNSWIQDKDTALKYRYLSLIEMQKKYKKLPEEEGKQKAEEIKQKIKDFKKEHAPIVEEIENAPSEYSNLYKSYKNQALNADLARNFARDAIGSDNRKAYDKLDDRHKIAYIRNIISGLKYAGTDGSFEKFALRRLELMNTENKKFITFEQDGNYSIDTDLLLQEYQSMSSQKFNTYEELVKYTELKKETFIFYKLEGYTKYKEEDFVKLDDPNDYDKSITQIEKARIVANTKKFKGTNFQRINLMKNRPRAVRGRTITAVKTVRENAFKGSEVEPLEDSELEDAVKRGNVGVSELDDSGTKQQNIERQDSEAKPLKDSELEDAVKKGNVEISELDDSGTKQQNVERQSSDQNQEEITKTNDQDSDGNSSNSGASELRVDTINATAAIEENEKNAVNNRVTMAGLIIASIKRTKDFITKLLKRENKGLLGTGKQNGVNATNVEEKEQSSLSPQVKNLAEKLKVDTIPTVPENFGQQNSKASHEPSEKVGSDELTIG